jgi:hypothetical protein
MSKTYPIWHGAVAISSCPCGGCGKRASVLFQLDERSWECRACVIDPAHGVRAIDRRGDTLRTPEQIAQELGLRTAIALHLAVRERLPGIDYGPLPDLPALPADYVQLLAVLDRASRVDAEFGNALSEAATAIRESSLLQSAPDAACPVAACEVWHRARAVPLCGLASQR